MESEVWDITDSCGDWRLGENRLLWEVKTVNWCQWRQCLRFEIPVQNLSYCLKLHRVARSLTAFGMHFDSRNSVALFSFSPCFYILKLFYSIIMDLVFNLVPPPTLLPTVMIFSSRCITRSDHKVSTLEPPKAEYLFRKESDLRTHYSGYHNMHKKSAGVF